MLYHQLAGLYGVPTKALKQAVRRNSERFPADFMFQLSKEEFGNWRSQIVTSNSGTKMGLRWRPYAFTEQGVAMLSSVLRSYRAVQVNIVIMRTFVQLRKTLESHIELSRKLNELETKYEGHDEKIILIFDAIRKLMMPTKTRNKRKIGFRLR